MNTEGKSCKSGICPLKGSCKAKLVFIIALVLACGAYVGFWHYQANEVKARVESELAPALEGGLAYEAITVAGFPFRYDVEIKNPNFEMKTEGESFRIEMDKIVVGSKIGDTNAYRATFGDVAIFVDYPEGGLESFSETLQFNVPPVIEVEFKNGFDAANLVKVSYEDQGFTVLLNGKNAGTVEYMNASFTRGDLGDNQHFFNIKGGYQTGEPTDSQITEHPIAKNLKKETIDKLLAMTKEVGKTNANLDITLTYTGPENINVEDPMFMASVEGGKLDIGSMTFKTESGLGYGMSGIMKMDKTSPMPVIDMKLSLFDFENFFGLGQDVITLIPEILAQSELSRLSQGDKDALLMITEVFKTITPEDLENVKGFLYEISDNPKEETKDVTISVKSEANGNISVGTMDAMQVERIFKKRFLNEEAVQMPMTAPTMIPPNPKSSFENE